MPTKKSPKGSAKSAKTPTLLGLLVAAGAGRGNKKQGAAKTTRLAEATLRSSAQQARRDKRG